MKTVKLKYFYFSILICVFVLSVLAHTLVHAAQTISGIDRLEEGIAAYEHGEYDDAIFKLEMAVYQIPEGEKDQLWEAHFYLGLSYHLTGDNSEAGKQFIKAQGITKNKLPDMDMHSPKILKMFNNAIVLIGPGVPGTFTASITGMEFMLVKGGCFTMGDIFGDGQDDEKPVHEICIDDFYIGKYEVTQGQWEEVMGNNPSYFKNGNNYSVESVSWKDVQGFIKELNQKTGLSYRLPTEAEWEYAARSGGRREKFAGFSNENELHKYANFCDSNCKYSGKREKQDDGYEYASPVGSYKPNGLGLCDMTGNVWEWCQDIYSEDAYKKHQRDNPIYTESGSNRVIRGGSWSGVPWRLRASRRSRYTPDSRNYLVGFRLARTP